MNKTVFLDMDGVIVDFQSAILKAHGVRYPDREGVFFQHVDLGLPNMNAFWEPTECSMWWAKLPWTLDGKAILHVVRSFCNKNNYKFKILTHPHGHWTSWAGKSIWLEKNGLLDDAILTRNKVDLAHHESILIDDSDDNVKQWKYGKAILVPRRWNSKYQERSCDTIHYVRQALESYLAFQQRMTANP